MRALVICAGGGAGDVLLATPVMRALHVRYDEVVALTLPAHRDVLAGNPDLCEVWVDDQPFWPTVARLREGRFDLALVTWSTARYAALPLWAGIPLRVGQARRLYSWMYNRRVTVKSELGDRATHWTQILLDYGRAVGCDAADPTPIIAVDRSASERITRLLVDRSIEGPYAVLHPSRGLSLNGRRWPNATLARLASELRDRFGVPIVVTGTAADRAIAEAVAAQAQATSLAGATTFPELTALLADARFCVAVDSGPMHVAAALGTPTVGIFALATDEPRRWAPYGPRTAVVTNTYPCPPEHRKETCPDFACLRDLDTKKVVERVARLLGESAVS